MGASGNDRRYWLDESKNVAKIYWGLCALCGGLFLGDALYHKHVELTPEGWFGFYGIYGFIGALALVLAAKQLRRFLMRGEDYYER